jgi:hypothetical protein
VTRSKFEDWIAEYLVPHGMRSGPNGWQRNCVSYRRALEVCRIESRAPDGRRLFAREIRIQQWLNGRSFPEQVIREDFQLEFKRSIRELLRKLRNSLPINKQKLLNENQLGTLRRQMGEASPQIVPMGFQYETSELLALISLFAFDEAEKIQVGEIEISPEKAISAILNRWGLMPLINSYFPDFGIFVCDAFAGFFSDQREFELEGESGLKLATQQQWLIARDLLRLLPGIIEKIPEIAGAFSGQVGDGFLQLADPCRKIAAATKEQQWRVFLFVVLLRAVTYCGQESGPND